MIGRFSIYVLIKFEIRLRLKVIYSNLLALNGTFRTVATQTPLIADLGKKQAKQNKAA
jgi:hypothetical protein